MQLAVVPECFIGEDLVFGPLVRILPKRPAGELSTQVLFPVQQKLPRRVRTFTDCGAVCSNRAESGEIGLGLHAFGG
jgi:DNA-binding transcriptional LysR family regulator